VRCGTQDIGTGTYTVFAQVLSEKTGMPLDRIDVILGDSALPDGPMSGGSMVTGSVLNAIAVGADGAIQKLQKLAAATEGSPFQNAKVENVSFTKGRIYGSIASARKARRNRRGKIQRPKASRCIPTVRNSSR
jgi:xanthine dehydrogenase YagR molybdenum-binding subunit